MYIAPLQEKLLRGTPDPAKPNHDQKGWSSDGCGREAETEQVFQTTMQDFKYLSNHLNSVQVFSINSNEKSYTENVYRCHCIQSRHVMCHTKSARIITYTKRRTWTQSSAYSYGLGFKKSGVWIWRVFR